MYIFSDRLRGEIKIDKKLSFVEVYFQGKHAGTLTKKVNGSYEFRYNQNYKGLKVSLTMPMLRRIYTYKDLPPFFEGLLPEGWQLEVFLKKHKLNSTDYLGQLVAMGEDLIGAVTIKPPLSYST